MSYKEILLQWFAMKKLNYSISKNLLNRGCKNIAIYDGGILGGLVYDELHHTDINISCIIDNKGKTAFPCNAEVITLDLLHKYPYDAVIIAVPGDFGLNMPDSLTSIIEKLRKVTDSPLINIESLVVDPELLLLLENVADYAANNRSDLFLFDFSEPTSFLKNPTIYEESCRYRRGKLAPDYFYQTFDGVDNLSEEYVGSMFRGYDMIEKDDGIYLADCNSEYYNVMNHCRITTDIPDSYDSTIHFFGACAAAGSYAEDKHTIESQLQRIMNDKKLHSRSYRVMNHACCTGGNIKSHLRRILATPISKGDIIVVLAPRIQRFMYHENIVYDRIHFFDVVPAFDRPHDYGEVFLDYTHVTHKGYTILANYIYDIFCDFYAEREMPEVGNSVSVSHKIKKVSNAKPLEDNRHGFMNDTLEQYLQHISENKTDIEGEVGAIVMNCNPFTNGHRYLIEQSLEHCDTLYIFVVEEDRSAFRFQDRFELVKQGTKDLRNVTLFPSGKFIISTVTFEEYFSKDNADEVTIDASKDVKIFAESIAPALNISKRFVGHEPICPVTRQYNIALKEILPQYGIELIEFERRNFGDAPISASRVRKLLQTNRFDEITNLVPETTFTYLQKEFASK